MPERLPVSVFVLTYNEEHHIEECLQSVIEWAGEVLVLDSGSTDRTVELAESLGAIVHQHPFNGYAAQRNWGMSHLPMAFPWVFVLDADERVTMELVSSLQKVFGSGFVDAHDGFLINRRTVFMGRWIRHGGHYPRYHLRLFLRDRGRCEDRLYDQHFVVAGKVKKLSGDMVDCVTPNLSRWLERHQRWALLEAKAQLDEMKQKSVETCRVTPRLAGTPIERRRWMRYALYGRAPLLLRALALFVYRYVIRLGFLDGRVGLVFHFLQGCWFWFYVDALIIESRQRGHDDVDHLSSPRSSG